MHGIWWEFLRSRVKKSYDLAMMIRVPPEGKMNRLNGSIATTKVPSVDSPGGSSAEEQACIYVSLTCVGCTVNIFFYLLQIFIDQKT